MTESTLNIKVNVSGAERDTRRFNGSLQKMEKAGDRASKGMDNMARSARGAVVGFGAVVGAIGAMRGLKDVVVTFAEFEQSISNLSAITGATGEDLEYLAQASRDLGAATTLSAGQVATAFKLVASAKPDLLESADALKEVTEQTIILAEAAGITLPAAAEALGNALNQYKAGADQANRFINVLAAGSKFGASSIEDVAAAMVEAGTAAAGANISIEETNAALQQLSLIGIKGSKAGTALRNTILRLQKEGVDKINPAVVGLTQALKNLNEQELTAVEMMELFGLESKTAADELVRSADAVGILAGKLTGTNTATEQAQISTDNLTGAWKRFNSAVEESKISIGDRLEPALRKIIDMMTSAISTGKGPVYLFGDALQEVADKADDVREAMSLLHDARALAITKKDYESVASYGESLKELAEELEDLEGSAQDGIGKLIELTSSLASLVDRGLDQGSALYKQRKEEIDLIYEQLEAYDALNAAKDVPISAPVEDTTVSPELLQKIKDVTEDYRTEVEKLSVQLAANVEFQKEINNSNLSGAEKETALVSVMREHLDVSQQLAIIDSERNQALLSGSGQGVAEAEAILNAERELLEIKREAKAEEEEFEREAAAKKKSSMQELDDLYKENRTSVEEYADELRELNRVEEELNENVKIGSDEWHKYKEAIERAKVALDETQQSTEILGIKLETLEDFTKQAADGMADAFLDFTTGAEQDFGDMAESILKDLAKIIIKAQLMKLLLGDSASGSGAGGLGNGLLSSIGGWIGGLFGGGMSGGSSNFMPQNTGGFHFPQFAAGGTPPVGKPYIVGENGPELRVDHKPGQIFPNGAGGSPVTVNVINNADGTETETTTSDDGQTIDVIITQAVKAGLSRGTFDRTMSGNFGMKRVGV